MIPIRALLNITTSVGPEQVDRFNGFLSAKVLGSGKPGISSGQAIDAVESVAARVLPPGYTLIGPLEIGCGIADGKHAARMRPCRCGVKHPVGTGRAESPPACGKSPRIFTIR